MPALQILFRRHGIDTDAKSVWDDWLKAAKEFAKLIGADPEKPLDGPDPPFRSFQESWPLFFEYAFETWKINEIDAQSATSYLFDELGKAPAYRESKRVVDNLRAAGVTVAIASNADDVHLVESLNSAEICVDSVISSEGVRAYKPRHSFYEALLCELNLTPNQVVHVGDNPIADVTGARSAGMYVYYVRRFERKTPKHTPMLDATWTSTDLNGLLDLVVPGSS